MTRYGYALFIGLILSVVLVACRPAPRTLPTQVGTPIDALPVSYGAQTDARTSITPVADAVIAEADAEHQLLTNIYQRISPAVVNIEVDVALADGRSTSNRGSGFIYDQRGHIVTSAHVIKDATDIRVTFNDGYLVQAQVVGLDTYSDLGVLRVVTRPDRAQPLALIQDSEQIQVGQRAIAIGNPFGLSSSMSSGIVSGVGRTLRSAELIDASAIPGFQNPSIIQTDTPINPGNSGGPLLNSRGEVMGVNAAIRSETGVFQGVGFAVPANTVRRVVPDLIAQGRVDYAWLGIYVEPEANGYGVAGLAEALSLPVDAGVLIRGITTGSPADVAGLRGGNRVIDVRGKAICTGGDIIVAVDGTYVDTLHELVNYLLVNTRPNDEITLLIVRNQQTYEVPLTLQARPDQESRVRDCEG